MRKISPQRNINASREMRAREANCPVELPLSAPRGARPRNLVSDNSASSNEHNPLALPLVEPNREAARDKQSLLWTARQSARAVVTHHTGYVLLATESYVLVLCTAGRKIS